MSTSTKQADRELNKFLNAQRDADIAAAANSFRTILAETVLQTYDFPIEPTAEDFRRLFQLRHQRYVNVSSMLLSIAKEDGKFVNVPVTPKSQTEPKKQSFHSISIICGDGAILEFLIREHDNYVIGFRVYLSIQAKDVTPWRTFGEDVPSRLGKSDPTNYDSNHVKLKEQEHRRANLCFRRRPTAEIDLSLLLGGEILLVKHDEEFGCKALIQEGGQFEARPKEATWE